MRLFIVIFILAIGSVTLFCQSKSELEAKKNSTLQEIAIAKELLEKTNLQKQNSLKRLSLLNRGIQSRAELIDAISNEIRLLDLELDQVESEITEIASDISKGKKVYAEIIYFVYKNYSEEEKLMYLLASEDINQFYQRIKYLKYLKEYRERKVAELESLKFQLEEKAAEMLRLRNEKAKLLAEKESETKSLENERVERNRMITRLSQDEQRIRKQINEKERIRLELEEKIKKIIEEETRRTSSKTLFSTLTPEQKLVGSNFLQNKGRLPWPVDKGVITAEYGLINHPVLKGVQINNNGIDISTEPRTIARAIFAGEVSSVFAILGANYAVIIKHGEYLTVYQNLIELKVKAGDKVEVKQPLGIVDSDDDVAVLHLQIRKERDILDPRLWLSK